MKAQPVWLAIGALAVALVISNIYTIYTMNESSERLEEQLHQARTSLAGQIAAAEQVLREQDEELGERLDASVMALRQESEARELETGRRISGLEVQIGSVEERSSALEQRIVELDIQSLDFTGIVQETLEGVVSIVTDRGLGSGAIVDSRGYVVTNAHVVAGIRQAAARTYDGGIHSIRIVAADAEADLALLQISGSGSRSWTSSQPAMSG